MTVLVVGATGSIGSLVVEETIRAGHAVRAFVRNASKARRLPSEVQVVVGMRLEKEPQEVRDDLDRVASHLRR
jgi:uncharacterized protein YbjT (DUF2867 family)